MPYYRFFLISASSSSYSSNAGTSGCSFLIDSVLLNKNPCGCLLKRSRFNRWSRQLIWLVQIIRQAINTQISPNNIVIIDSFPLSLCQPVRNHSAHVFNELADIGYNSSKHLWVYGFKVHMLVTLSGYILNYVVTPASVHDIRAIDDLLENCSQPYVLADLAYLSYELREQLKQKG